MFTPLARSSSEKVPTFCPSIRSSYRPCPSPLMTRGSASRDSRSASAFSASSVSASPNSNGSGSERSSSLQVTLPPSTASALTVAFVELAPSDLAALDGERADRGVLGRKHRPGPCIYFDAGHKFRRPPGPKQRGPHDDVAGRARVHPVGQNLPGELAVFPPDGPDPVVDDAAEIHNRGILLPADRGDGLAKPPEHVVVPRLETRRAGNVVEGRRAD